MSTVEVRWTNPLDVAITLDGHRVENLVTYARIEMDPTNRRPRLVLDIELDAGTLNIRDAQPDITLDTRTAAILRAAGWQPPNGDRQP